MEVAFYGDFETLWPQDATKFCSSRTVVLWFFFASIIIFLTVRGDNMHLRLLPGKLQVVQWLLPEQWLVVYFTMDVLYPLPDLCGTLLIWQFFDFPHGDGWQRNFTCLLPHFFTLVKPEVKEGHNTVLKTEINLNFTADLSLFGFI